MASSIEAISIAVGNECPICSEPFDNPRLLPCLHTVCKSCMDDIISLAQTKPPTCRTCGEPFDVGITAVNYAIAPTQATIPNCEECDENTPAAFVCETCAIHFCRLHADAHHHSKRSRSHLVSQVLTSPTNHTAFCCEHPARELASFCADCQRLVCLECINSPRHFRHGFLSFEEASTQLSASLEVDTTKLLDRLPILDKAVLELDELRSALETRLSDVTNEITSTFNLLISQLEQRRESLLALAKSELQSDMKTTELQRDNLSLARECVLNVGRQTSLMRSGLVAPLVERVRLYGMVSTRVSLLHSTEPALKPMVRNSLRFSLRTDPWRVPATGLGNVGRKRDFSSVGAAISVFGTRGSEAGQFSSPSGMAVTLDGCLVVADPGNLRLQILTESGDHVRTISMPQGEMGPRQVAVSPITGDIWAADLENDLLLCFSQDGLLKQRIPCDQPFGIGILKNGDLVVSSGDTYVRAFSVDGVERWASQGGGLKDASGLEVTPNGEVLVCDFSQNVIHVLSATDGRFLRFLGNGQLVNPNYVTVGDAETVLVTEAGADLISVWNFSGERIYTFSATETGQPTDASLSGIAVLPDGRIAVADWVSHCVRIY